MIRLSNVNKYYNKGTQAEIHVLNNVTLELPSTGMTAVFGKSGCGKTTLLNVIGGLDQFGSGIVEIDGQNIKKNTDVLRNRQIGYIFQNYCLNKEQTVFENIANALYLCGIRDKAVVERRVKTALHNVDMDGYGSRLPDTLSGGQQQRIAIARAIVKTPKIILADEPTGNLDEANTVKIMDLLRALSEDCLVLLVTHEEKLVDYYCDTVIEISDGCVAGIRENRRTGGYVAKDKNTVYLGEYEKTEAATDLAKITYYGEKPKEPLGITVVNKNGSLFLKISDNKVRFLDESAEIRLVDGVFETTETKHEGTYVDMTDLPPIEGENFGKLYTFRSSVKNGYKTIFRKGKKSKRGLRRIMGLFAAVLVFMTAFFGTAVKSLSDIDKSYDHNVFYVLTDESEDSRILLNATAEESGIDFLTLRHGNYFGIEKQDFSLQAGFFETFPKEYSFSNETVMAVDSVEWLGKGLADGLTVVAGTKENLSENEILLSTNVADRLLEISTWGYVKNYDDLLHLPTESRYSSGGKPFSVAGIVKTEEPAVYGSEIALAELCLSEDYYYGYTLARAVTANFDVNPGYVHYCYYPDEFDIKGEGWSDSDGSDGSKDISFKFLHDVGDKVLLYGKEFTVSSVSMNETSWGDVFYLADEDLIALSKEYGGVNGDDYGYPMWEYTAIHSSDPAKTEAFLTKHFVEEEITTPDDQFNDLMVQNNASVVGNLIALIVIFVLMSICMYFVMRSAMMTKIREYGILRAIGVSSKNLLFRSFSESLLLTTLTVTVGFLISSVFVRIWLTSSPLFSQILFYPLWLAGVLLILIYAICIFCGILPMLFLLRKTPSEILSKYDI